MVDPILPADLVALLRQGMQPKYDPAICEAGAVTFLPLDQLKVEFFPMNPHGSDDPHADEPGSYLVTGVSLLASCDGYDPVGLLLWLPLEVCYGTWDGEHGTLRVFRKEVDWSAIAKDPPHYINSQWGLEGSAPVSDLAPWDRHAYNAEQLHHPLPDIPEWYEAKWLRRGMNSRGQAMAAPYCARPFPGATVSAPLKWSEVRKGLDPRRFTIKTMPKRLEKVGDLWTPVLGEGVDLVKCLPKLS